GGKKDPALLWGERQHAGCHREIDDRRDEYLAAADPVGDVSPDIGTGDGANTRGEQDKNRLTEGELPRRNDEDQDTPAEIVIEEFEGIADGRRCNDLPLIGGEPRLLVKILLHLFLPTALLCRNL